MKTIYLWGKDRVAGRVRLLVSNRGSGRVNGLPGPVGLGPRKVTRGQLCLIEVRVEVAAHVRSKELPVIC